MSENSIEKTLTKGELKFVRLKNIAEDLIGYVTYKEQFLIIETPLRIEIETIIEEGRQILAMHEYLPQSVIELREIEIPFSEILFATAVREESHEQYEYVSDFFYNNSHELKEPSTKVKKKNKKETKETEENVVSLLGALANKKDKPVH